MELRGQAARRSGRSPVARIATLVAVILTALAVALTPSVGWAQAERIQPGASIVSEGGGQCTLNWIYDGQGHVAGRVFVGTARHCVSRVGEVVTLQTGTFGEPVRDIGRVAFMSRTLDYALIEVDPEDLSLVDPALKGHAGFPTGVATRETTSTGDLLQFSGNGVGYHLTSLTRQQRVGVLQFHSRTQWGGIAPVSPGDSGGPVADITAGNRALGIVTDLCLGLLCGGASGVSLEGLLKDAAASGFPVELRTI